MYFFNAKSNIFKYFFLVFTRFYVRFVVIKIFFETVENIDFFQYTDDPPPFLQEKMKKSLKISDFSQILASKIFCAGNRAENRHIKK
jgi:hypothetical protein